MLEALIPELAACGLQRNVAKTKKIDNVSYETFRICWCMWWNGTIYSCWISAQICGPELKRQLSGMRPSFPGCLEQISQNTNISSWTSIFFSFCGWNYLTRCCLLLCCWTRNVAIDRRLFAKTWCRAKTNASVYNWVGSSSWYKLYNSGLCENGGWMLNMHSVVLTCKMVCQNSWI